MILYFVLHSWLRTKISMNKSIYGLAKGRRILWRKLQNSISKTPALKSVVEFPLDKLPIISYSQMREDVKQWNSCGITHSQAITAANEVESGGRGKIINTIVAGYSTGTSGKRGIFLSSSKERAIYLGQNIAKFLSLKLIFNRPRILLFLRANSKLYSDSGNLSFIKFGYFPLSLSAKDKFLAFKKFNPSILIAPSHVLVEITKEKISRRDSLNIPDRCFYGAEPMSDNERDWIHNNLGIRPDPIYQATEGFIGASCKFGRLHLNEDNLEITFKAIKGTSGGQIIVTDLLRETQPIVNVELDDFIELDEKNCQCGFSGRVILPVCGRVSDLWHFDERIITPRQITSIIESVIDPPLGWSIVGSSSKINLFLENSITDIIAKEIIKKLKKLLMLECPIRVTYLEDLAIGPKRQRVRWESEK